MASVHLHFLDFTISRWALLLGRLLAHYVYFNIYHCLEKGMEMLPLGASFESKAFCMLIYLTLKVSTQKLTFMGPLEARWVQNHLCSAGVGRTSKKDCAVVR